MSQANPSRKVSSSALLLASVSSILGSGWLFAAYYTSTMAGPAAIVAWLLGGAMIMLIAFVFAELAAMIPISGSSVRIPQYTHGTTVSFIFSWFTWLAWVSLVPTEVQAVIQYISFYIPNLIHSDTSLTHTGYLYATTLMLIISIINIYSLRWLMRCNIVLTILKIFIPLFICAVILSQTGLTLPTAPHFHQQNFAPMGMHGIFAAIASGGILFTFNGFKQACEMAGEAKNPGKSLPLAVVGSVLICLVIYLILQWSFIAAIDSDHLKGGWQNLHLPHAQSPFASILHLQKLTSMMPILYIGAIIGPLAAAFLNMLSASRALYGKSKNGYLPQFLQHLNGNGNPVYAIIVCFACGMVLFAPLPGWHQMITFLTSIMAITYAIAPICVISLRKQVPDLARPFALPYAPIWATAAFYICNLLIYWSGWQVISKLSIALIIGLIVFIACRLGQKPNLRPAGDLRAASWIWPYFIGLSLISYLGNFGHGHAIIPVGWDYIALAALSIFIMLFAQHLTLPAQQTKDWLEHLKQNKEAFH